jgi:GH15 family glucan-1,4-alpha-glucosidase
MPRIEDYALIGNLRTAALVARDGSIDWLCMPRFDAGACFAALLGDQRHGQWQIAPAGAIRRVGRRYRPGTLVLDTEFETADGTVRLTDFMVPGTDTLVRIVEGLRGPVQMRMRLTARFDYGTVTPWVTGAERHLALVAGPDALRLTTPVATRGEDTETAAEFRVVAGQRVPFVLQWHASHAMASEPVDAEAALAHTQGSWEAWSGRGTYSGRWQEPVRTSLAVLRGLTHADTGGIVAAPTTSLPEALGGVRNWDYRFCWVRDAVLSLSALLQCGYPDEALAFRDWLLRACAGNPRELRIMYGIAGERRLPETEIGSLPGYEGAAPVRVGNAAAEQFQLDVYGELADVNHLAREVAHNLGWSLDDPVHHVHYRRHLEMLDFLETAWRRPDEGIWEVRGPRRHYTHSKILAWVAFDRAVRAIEQFARIGPLDRFRRIRAEIHDEVCRKGFDADRGTFTQSYGSAALDASLLLIPTTGFLPARDARVIGTVEAVQRELCQDGFVARYPTAPGERNVDGLPGKEGAFLPCSFWLADALALIGRRDEAVTLFRRLLELRNDLGLLSEEYDVDHHRLVGNFPQAFTHLALIHTATRLDATDVHTHRAKTTHTARLEPAAL